MDTYLNTIAEKNRVNLFKMFYKSKTGHLAPALSCIDILSVLYFGGILKKEDYFILSKGHAAAALYSILAEKGFFPLEKLNSFYQKGTKLKGMASIGVPGITVSTGSLGHGICFATGLAKAGKLDNKDTYVYVLLGDGEMQEGSVWEAAMFSKQQRLDNLIVVLDNNRVQASDYTDNIVDMAPVKQKWEAFGWNVLITDGHDLEEIKNTFLLAKKTKGSPVLIIANTIKGKGISFMQDAPDKWHVGVPDESQWEQICAQYGISMEELRTS